MYKKYGISDMQAFMSRWQTRLEEGKKARTEWFSDTERGLELIQGKQWTSGELESFGSSYANTANITWSLVEIMSATIFNRDPLAIVTSRHGNFKEAELVQSLLNYWYRELGLKSVIKGTVRTSLVAYQGFIKMGYTKKVLTLKEGTDSAGNTTEAGTPAISYEPHRLEEDSLWVEEVDPRRIVVDANARSSAPSMPDARWIAEKVDIPLEAIINDDVTYPPVLKEGLTKLFQADGENVLSCWEIYDKRTGKIILLCEGHDKPLRVEDYDFSSYEHFPYLRLVFRPIPWFFYGKSDVFDLYPLQRSLNHLLTKAVDHLERQRTVLLARDTLQEDEIDRIAHARHGELVRVSDPTAVNVLSLQPLSPELFNGLSQVLLMVREQTGLSDYMRGGAVKGVMSATEAATISQGDQLRLGDRREVLEVFIRDMSRYLYKLMRKNFTKTQLIPIDSRATSWVKVSPKEIRGEFSIQIENGSVSPLDKSLEITRASQVLQTLTPFIEAGIVKIRPALENLIKSIGQDPAEVMLTDEEALQNNQQEQMLNQLAQENEQLKAALTQIQAAIQSGELQVAKGEDRTAVPIDELRQEIEGSLPPPEETPPVEEAPPVEEIPTNPLLETEE